MSDWIAFLRDTAEPLVSLKALGNFVARVEQEKAYKDPGRPNFRCIAKPYADRALRGEFLSSILKVYTGVIYDRREHSPTTGTIQVAYQTQLRMLTPSGHPFGLAPGVSTTTSMIYVGNKIALKFYPELYQHSGIVYAGVKLGDELSLEEALLSEFSCVREAAKKQVEAQCPRK